MRLASFGLLVLVLLLLPIPASADGGLALSARTLAFFPVAVIVEILVVWLLGQRVLAPAARAGNVVRVVLVANVASTAAGFPLESLLDPRDVDVGRWLAVTFAVSVVIEWATYLLLLPTEPLRPGRLMGLATLANLCSYLLLGRTVALYTVTAPAFMMGDLRTVASAEAVYESAGHGYARVECLVTPRTCIDGYSATDPGFVDARFLIDRRGGYAFTFVPGPTARDAPGAGGPRAGLSGFAYYAVPLGPEGDERLWRALFRLPMRYRWPSYCTDETGEMRRLPPEQTPGPLAHPCPATWPALR